MDIIYIIPVDVGPAPTELVRDEKQNFHGHHFMDRATWSSAYHVGIREPRFPVPAIRQHFEWGQNLGTGEIVLIHAEQGVYTVPTYDGDYMDEVKYPK